MEQIADNKAQMKEIMEILRTSDGKMSNVQIAKLNDLAYKGVR